MHIILLKMETVQMNNEANEPKKKGMNDFVLTFLWIGGLIGGLMLLKYLMSALHLM
jgi:hypothetical protein